jgi:1-pyrroline-5-carboxylate dehydrogenase
MAEVSEAIDMIRYHAEAFSRNRGFVTPMKPESPFSESVSVMKPYGTWAVISPFNFPISLAAGMAAAALICGNTVILKPTSTAPFSCLKLYEAFIEGGVPEDAVHYLTGPGGKFGDIVTAHPDIDGIAFTGSRDAGVWLQRSFTERQPYPKPVVAEMGSKDPVIVTAHADLKKAVEGITRAAFGYGGQKCSATSRVYAHTLIFDAFTEALKTKTQSLSVGDPRARETDVGPVIDRKAVETFQDAVERTRRDGGKIITGGEVLSGDRYARGHYVQPTIVTGLKNGHPLIKKELFVPLVIVEPFESLDEALRMANDTDFGLTAGIFSENEEEIRYFFNHIQSGVTYANRRAGATTGAWPGSQPFCGWKASGFSGRGVGGPWYLLSYMREQAQTRVK